MPILFQIVDFILHFDKHLIEIINIFGIWSYILLFLVIFCETGLFMAIILPEESLLFIVGSLSALDKIDIWMVMFVVIIATLIGDSVNYFIGRKVGLNILNRKESMLIKKKHIYKAQEYYNNKGNKTVIIGRTLPIIRTFIPFVAGMAGMSYWRFIAFNMLGALPWLTIYIIGGFFLGNIPFVERNFTFALLIIVLIPLLPSAIKFFKNLLQKS
ncbi:VTT domain-containing protein [Clostridium sp. YIM B02505]|uniref:VTT domain-containing protein n=1 Tax=Clostridium yunnanense TaxID=2800325 RepID=A0ABS1ETY2_9CLOT|nr:VTT domain-containing protein [Clostridium yunnanense]MBK1812800.1 VTT domain-containing protein [Clostridium yunnanense]